MAEKQTSDATTVFPDSLEYVGFQNVLAFLAARYDIHVTRRTWYRWTQQRVTPPRLRMGNSILYRVADLKNWVEGFRLEHVRRPARGRRG